MSCFYILNPILNFLSQLRRVADHAQPDRCQYSLSTLPDNAGWSGRFDPPVLSVNDVPVILRVVGVLEAYEYQVMEGFPPTFDLSLYPLRPVDKRAMWRLYRSSRPVPGMFSYDLDTNLVLIQRRWLSSKHGI